MESGSGINHLETGECLHWACREGVGHGVAADGDVTTEGFSRPASGCEGSGGFDTKVSAVEIMT